MLICKHCGKTLDDEALFCSKCGASTQPPTTETSADFDFDLSGGGVSEKINLEKLSTGFIIDDNYEIKSKIAQGTFCPIYHVYDRKTKSGKALKILPEAIANDIEAMEIFHQEAKTKIWLNHPNIVRVYDFHELGSIKFIEMEYIDGKSLTEIKLNNPDKRLPERMVRNLVLPIIKGLIFAHNQNIIHRDIKPQNIILTSDGKIKILDFSIAESLRRSMSIVKNTTLAGTIMYMSPEQIRGKSIGLSSDIYSLGAMLYDLLCGHPPFYQGDIYNQIIHEKPEVIPGVSTNMNAILRKCMAKDQAERFRDCEELREVLIQDENDWEDNIIKEEVKKEIKEIKQVSIPKAEDIELEKEEEKETYTEDIKFPQKVKPPVIFATVLLMIIAVMISIRIIFFSGGEEADDTEAVKKPQKEAWENLSENEKVKVNALLKAADGLFMENKLTAPSGNNAYELYLQVQKILPGETHSNSQLDSIKGYFIKRARIEIDLNNYFSADKILNAGLKYFPSDSGLIKLTKTNRQTMRALAAKRPLKIEILNGAGEKGIAKILAEKLNIGHNYNVVNTENYRESGRINWNVQKTKIINRVGDNFRTKKLAELIGVNYTLIDSSKYPSDFANITIILGKDYNNLPAFKN